MCDERLGHCPFCGGELRMKNDKEDTDYISCDRCDVIIVWLGKKEDETIAAWNGWFKQGA